MNIQTRSLHPGGTDVILFTGNYGSGKTEVSVNVATALAHAGEKVAIADLDLVNPYFRCREARQPMEALGIRVIAPDGNMHNADLPILMPEVMGVVQKSPGITILDVGGDNVGATVLAALATVFRVKPYQMYFVLNQNRPFTDTVEGANQLMDEIETASRLRITGIVSNTHMMDETDIPMVQEGIRFGLEVAESRDIPLVFATAPRLDLIKSNHLDTNAEEAASTYEFAGFDAPILPLRRIMLPPWLGGPTPGSMATHSRDRFAQL
ncbi:cobalamin biosynthesis protein CbiA [bacterium]|nr:cobalamin biosynthesis protein CbiA [bacterium]